MKTGILIILLVAGINSSFSQTIKERLIKAADLAGEKKFEEAMKIYQDVWKKDSLNYDLYIGRGELYFSMDEREKSFLDFTKAINLKPDSAIGYLNRARVLYSLMYTEESIIDNSRAIEKATNDTIRMIGFMNRGSAKQQKRDYQGAYEDYFRASQYSPGNIGILNNIATVLDDLGRTDEAVEYLLKIIKIDSTFIGSYVNIGFQYTRMKRYKEAIAYFNKALTINKDEPLTLNNRGLAKYYLQDYEGALADINKSLSIYPENSYAYKNRALVYIARGEKDKACDDLKKANDLGFVQMYGEETNDLLKANCK